MLSIYFYIYNARAYAQESTKTSLQAGDMALKKTEILYYRKMAEKMIIENGRIDEYTDLIKERINDINGYLSRTLDANTQSALIEQRSKLRAEYRALMYRRRVFMRAWKKLTEEERALLSELCKREYYEKLGGIYRQEESLVIHSQPFTARNRRLCGILQSSSCITDRIL